MANKEQTLSGGAAAGARRLGRGLSSLLAAPVAVEVEGKVSAEGGVRNAEREEAAARAGSEPERVDRARDERDGNEAGRIVMVGLDEIVPNRWQPRKVFDQSALAELAASIRTAGLVQPVLVRANSGVGSGRSASDGGSGGAAGSARYELVAGERRWRAARLAGVTKIPAVVAELSDEQSAEWALIENVQRADLQPLEQGRAIKQLCTQFGMTHAQAADKLGLDRSSVTNLVRLTELEPEIQALMEQGSLSAAHGKALLAMEAGPRRVRMAELAAKEDWSLRELTQDIVLTAKMKGGGKHLHAVGKRGGGGGAGSKSEDADARGLVGAGLADLEAQLSEYLQTKVELRVRGGGKRGKLIVHFYDLNHFDGLMETLGFEMK